MALTPDDESRLESEVERLAEEYLDRLQQGEEPDREALLAAHPALAGRLERRLRVLEKLARARGAMRRDPARPGGHLRCPQCGQRVHWIEPAGAELCCPGCGSPIIAHALAGERMRGEVPERIGKFRVIELVGRGAFGAVYKAHDEELDRIVAVKVPRAGWLMSSEEAERFQREARSAAQLKHPGIVPVFETVLDHDVPFIVSQFVENRTLAEVIAAGRPAFGECASIVAQVAEALDYAHGQKVIHRDVKPQNILMGSDGRPHVSDFGLARREGEDVTVTVDGQVLGTPAYMSPEQAAGEHSRVDARSDVYGLGVVLYELLTGERPFRGSKNRVLEQVLHDEPRPPRSLNDHIPRDLETICLKAMEKDPAARYVSAGALAQDLRRYLKREPIHARPVGRIERAARWVHRNPLVSSLAGGAAALLAITAVTSTVAYFRVQDSLEQTKRAEERTTKALEESRRLLVRGHASRGAELLRQGDYLGALPWFLEAMRYDGDDRETRARHEARLGAILEQCPRLESLWFAEGRGLWRELSGDLKRAVFAFTNGLEVRDVVTGKSFYRTEEADVVAAHDLSEDGRILAVSLPRSGLIVRDLDAGRERRITVAAPPRVLSLSRDGRLLATVGKEGPLEVVTLDDPELPRSTIPREMDFGRLLFSPDGRLLVGCSYHGETRLWDARTAEPLGPAVNLSSTVAAIVFNESGSRVALGALNGIVKVLDIGKECTVTATITIGSGVQSAAFARDGALLLTGSEDKTARLWNATTGMPAGPPLQHGSGVLRASFARDGRRVITGDREGCVRFWDPFNGKDLGTRLWHSGWIQLAELDGDGKRIVTCSMDGGLRVWTLADDPAPRLEWSLGGGFRYARLVQEGRKVLTHAVHAGARVWDLASGEPSTPPFVDSQEMHLLRSRAEGDIVWGSSLEGALRCWNGHTGELVGSWPALGDRVVELAVGPGGKRIALGTLGGNIYLWARDGGWKTLSLGSQVLVLTFSADGRRLLAAGAFGMPAKVWDLDGGGEPLVLDHAGGSGGPTLGAAVSAAGFVQEERGIVSGDLLGTVKLWNATTGALEASVDTHQSGLIRAAFEVGGTRFATFYTDGDTRIWSTAEPGRVTPLIQIPAGGEAAAFSPDGRTLATGDREGSLQLWDLESGEPMGPRLRHGAAISNAFFLSDGKEVLTCSLDGSVRVWAIRRASSPPEGLEDLVQVLSCRVPNGRGGLDVLSPESLHAVWARLGAR